MAVLGLCCCEASSPGKQWSISSAVFIHILQLSVKFGKNQLHPLSTVSSDSSK